CDGPRFVASGSTRDRDRLRDEVLRQRGWTILRVWSTDWFDDPDEQTTRLVARLDELRARQAIAAEEVKLDLRTDMGELPAEEAAGQDDDIVPVSANDDGDDATAAIARGLGTSDVAALADDGPVSEQQAAALLTAFR